MIMNRKQKLLLNATTGLLKQIITVVCGFILPRYFLLYYGSNVNGLVSSITHFLGFITLLEMGIGPVIQSNLYKPLAENDATRISQIVKSSEKFFRRIAYIFLAYIAALSVIFPLVLDTNFDFLFTFSLVLIISISTIAQYFFGATYQLFLTADQKAYIQVILQIGTIVLNTVICIVLMKIGASIHIVKLASSAIFVIRPLIQLWYVRKHYQIDRKIKYDVEPIKQKWNGFAQHIAAVVTSNIDIVILTFISLASVSVYSVYYNVTNGVTMIIMTAATGLEAFFGNMLAKNEKDALNQSFEIIEFIIHFSVTIIFAIAAFTIVPFISVYTRGIEDANYIQPLFGLLLIVAYASQCLRIPYFRIIKAAGHYKETQNGAFISMGLNIVLSIVLVFFLDLTGLAIGTLVAMLYHTVYFAWYLRKNILNRSILYFIKYIICDIVIFISCYFITQISWFNISALNYQSWIIVALKVALIVVPFAILANCIFSFKIIAKITKMVISKFKKVKNV